MNHFQDLEKEIKISQKIPQLGELSEYLQRKTGFTIKPTHGILSQREFLNAFAFKIFCSTQYLRNVKNPDYTPEPDIVHEILGHIPMFADPQVAVSFSISRNSLKRSDYCRLEPVTKKSLNLEVSTGLHWSLAFAKRTKKLKAMVLELPARLAKSMYYVFHLAFHGPRLATSQILEFGYL